MELSEDMLAEVRVISVFVDVVLKFEPWYQLLNMNGEISYTELSQRVVFCMLEFDKTSIAMTPNMLWLLCEQQLRTIVGSQLFIDDVDYMASLLYT